MDTGLSINMLYEDIDYLVGEIDKYGVVSEVGEYYVKLDDGTILLCLEKQNVEPGDTVHAVCTKSGNNGKGIASLISIEKYTADGENAKSEP